MKETQKTTLMTKIDHYLGDFAKKHPIIYTGSLVAFLAGTIYGVHKIKTPKPKKPNFLEWISDKKYIQRNGSRVYVDEFWYPIDDNTKKKCTVIYVDRDNNGFPESSCGISSDGGWIGEHSNTEMFNEGNVEYFGKEK